MEQRRFHRVKFTAPGELKHHEMKYRCRLENVSLRGALISADECLLVPLNESCTLTVNVEADREPIVITVSVVHCFFSMVGVKFVAFPGDSEVRLLELLKRNTTEPEKLMQEWECIKKGQPVSQAQEEIMAEPATAIY